VANASQSNEMLMFLANGSSLATYLKGGTRTFPITSVADNSWHHLVWTRSGATNCIYRDGVQQGACQGGLSSAAVSIANNGLVIGQEQDSVGGGFDINQEFEGQIDQVRVYASALSTADTTALYNETQPNCPTCQTTASEWHLDECSYAGTPNEVLDNSGTNHGTRYGGVSTNSTGQVCGNGTFTGAAGTYINLGNNASMQLSSGTVTAWIKTANAGSSYRGIVVKQSAYGLFLNGNELVIYDWSAGSGGQF